MNEDQKNGASGSPIAPMGMNDEGVRTGVPMSGPKYAGSGASLGIGQGDGGPTIDEIGPGNPM